MSSDELDAIEKHLELWIRNIRTTKVIYTYTFNWSPPYLISNLPNATLIWISLILSTKYGNS